MKPRIAGIIYHNMKFNTSISLLLILLLSSSVVFSYAAQEYLLTNNVLIDYLNMQLDQKQIQIVFEAYKKLTWINYIFNLVIILFKVTLISLWILCGFIIYGYNITFNEIFRLIVIAEYFWLIPTLLTLIWFGFIETDYSLIDVQYFKPFSLLNLFEASKVEGWLIFPLHSLNLFEIIYMFILSIGIKKIIKKDYKDALNFTIPVYGSALVTWIVFITFLSINLNT